MIGIGIVNAIHSPFNSQDQTNSLTEKKQKKNKKNLGYTFVTMHL